MLNSEPQTNVITSETLQIFVLLSDLSSVPDVKAFLEKYKKGYQFFQGGTCALLAPP